MCEEEGLNPTPNTPDYIYNYLGSFKMYFNSLNKISELLNQLKESDINTDVALYEILNVYVGLNSSKIGEKKNLLQKTKSLNDSLHVALLRLGTENPTSNPLFKTTKAGEYLYSLYGLKRDKDTCRKTINTLIDRKDETALVPTGPMRGRHKTVYQSDIDLWFKNFRTTFTTNRT